MADDDTGRETEEMELDLDAPADVSSALREAMAAVEAGAPAGAAPGTDPPAEVTEVTEATEVAKLRREVADLRDRSMRTLADFDNYRKRSDRERQEARRFALLDPLRELLPVVDNLERALSAGGSLDDLKTGVGMILRQVQELLRRHGVTEVPAQGAPFDPAVHEAVSREVSAAVAAPTVAEELQRGYRLHDRLLRPAMVKVAVPADRETPAPGGDDGGPAL